MDEGDEIRAAAEKELQALALEGLNSGEPIRPDASYWEEMHQQLDERLKIEPRTRVELPEQIEIRPNIMGGKPCLKGTHIPVYLVLEKLRAGETADEILTAYPQLHNRPHHGSSEVCRPNQPYG